jgi:hypothetical protein
MCKWVLLPDKEDPTERRCSDEGASFCVEHDAELHWHTWRELERHEKSERLRQREEKWRKEKRLIEFQRKKAVNLPPGLRHEP